MHIKHNSKKMSLFKKRMINADDSLTLNDHIRKSKL